MKKRILIVVLMVLTVSVAMIGCKKVFKDLVYTVNNKTVVPHQVQVQVLNANSASTTQPVVSLAVSTVTPNQVVDISGVATPKFMDGIAQLAIRPDITIPVDRPFEMVLQASAPGFLPVTKALNVRSVDSLSVVTIEMIEIDKTPDGVASLRSSLTPSSATGETPTVSVLTLPAAKNVRTYLGAEVTIPKATVLYDEAGVAVKSPLSFASVQYNVTAETAVNLMPGGGNSPDKVQLIDGSISRNTGFVTFGMADVMMQAGTQKVRTFSKPLTLALDVDTRMKNPMTNAPLKSGDSLWVVSLSEGSTIWKQEGKAVVFYNTAEAKYQARVQMTHLSAWAVVGALADCGNNLTINFTRTDSSDNLHYVEIRQANASVGTGTLVKALSNVRVKPGGSYQLAFKLSDAYNYDILVYDGDVNSNKGSIIGTRANIAACSATTSIAVDPSVNGNPILRFNLTANCLDASNNILASFLQTGRVQYRLAGSTGTFYDMGFATNGIMYTDRLAWAQIYEFRTIITSQMNGSAVTKTTRYFRNRNTKLIEFTNYGTNKYYFTRTNWTIPDNTNACADYGF